MHAGDLAFGVLALAALCGAAGVLLSRSTVHAALWLLELSLAVAGLCLLLSSEFLALVVVILWGGAASLLLLVTIAVTAQHGDRGSRPREGSLRAAVLATTLAAIMLARIAGASFDKADRAEAATGVAHLGEALFADPVITAASGALSLLLLVALVAGVWWSRGGDGR